MDSKHLIIGLLSWLLFSSFQMPLREDLIYLSYVHDPSSAITIQWHSNSDYPISSLRYRKQGDPNWLEKEGCYLTLLEYDYLIHRVDITDLTPDTSYEFILCQSSIIHSFRTLPDHLENNSIKLAIGGDVFASEKSFYKMASAVRDRQPHFVILGGDIVYTDAGSSPMEKIKKWNLFFQAWNRAMRSKEGNLIPMVVVPGNHDHYRVIHSRIPAEFKDQPFFYFFPCVEGRITYRSLDLFGSVSFFLLDSHHFYPIQGSQTEWLKTALMQRSKFPLKIGIYHIPAYPSIGALNDPISTEIRRHWCPLFDAYNVKLAFEHHCHTYKRTLPLRNGRIDPQGVIYIGDGCWGKGASRIRDTQWFLAKVLPTTCANILTLYANQARIEVISDQGDQLDYIELIF